MMFDFEQPSYYRVLTAVFSLTWKSHSCMMTVYCWGY